MITATYQVQTTAPQEALTAVCRGQSVGNPTRLSRYETPDFLARWAAQGTLRGLDRSQDLYEFTVKWPRANFASEGLNYLLSVVLGGQCDIDLLQSCRLVALDVSGLDTTWPGPRYGHVRIRQLLGLTTPRPLIGGILKPKIGLRPAQLVEIVKQLADGGCDFIKEDEILADQYWCPMRQRLPLVAKALQGYHVLYATCVTGDGSEVWQKARLAKKLGATAIHLNVWCSLGTYLDVRRHVELPLFFQKSGDKVWTTGPFSLAPTVLYQLAHLAGCDFAHVGMYGGYLAEPVGELQRRMVALKTTIPSFSCGMTPTSARQIVERFGTALMLTTGGYVHSHPDGIVAAVKALCEAAYGHA